MLDQSLDLPQMSLKNTFEPYSKDSFLPPKNSSNKNGERELVVSDTFEVETLSQPYKAEVLSYSGSNDMRQTGILSPQLNFQKKSRDLKAFESQEGLFGRNSLSFH